MSNPTPKELADRLLSYANDLECEYGKDHHANKGWLKDLRQASKCLRQLEVPGDVEAQSKALEAWADLLPAGISEAAVIKALMEQAARKLRSLSAQLADANQRIRDQAMELIASSGEAQMAYEEQLKAEAERDQLRTKCEAWEPVIRAVVLNDLVAGPHCALCASWVTLDGKNHNKIFGGRDCPVPAALEKLNGKSND